MTYDALIPLRGGSKSIPRKNILPIAGRPLFAWSAMAALESGVFESVWVSTDDPEIADLVRATTPAVKIIDRPAHLAQDDSSTESVMLHALDYLDGAVLCTIQATSPLVTAEDFRSAVARFDEADADSLVTAARQKRFFWTDDGTPINYDPLRRPRRQDFAGTLTENGAFYLTRRSLLEESRCRLGGSILVHEMPPETLTEIDEPADWTVVERLLRQRRRLPSTISLVVVDVDGTLTDGGMYYNEDGETLKRFNTRDAVGLRRLAEAGITVAIMSGEDSPIVSARARKLNIEHVFLGVSDKRREIENLLSRLGQDWSRTAMIGDDLNDREAMQMAGFSACPADAIPDVRSLVDLVATHPGGHGAVREICEAILDHSWTGTEAL